MVNHNSLNSIHPLAKARIDEIREKAKYPLILLLGVSGVGKNSILEKLLQDTITWVAWLKKMKRPTTRKQKDRDLVWDYEYLTDEQMQQALLSGDILFAYDSHRSDWSVYGLYYEELKKLEHHPLITAIWQWWLKVIEYVPSIVCCLFRDENGIKDSLLWRLTDDQTLKNVENISRDTVSFLQKAKFADIMVENETGNNEKTVQHIKQTIAYLTRKQDEHVQLLDTIFGTSMIDQIYWKEIPLFVNRLLLFLKDDNDAVSAEKIDSLIHFMYRAKFSSLRRYFKIIGKYGAEITPEGIQEDMAIMYKQTAEIIYALGYQKEAKHILLQIWLREYAFPEHIQRDVDALVDNRDIASCIDLLSEKYDYYSTKGSEMIFVHNTYAFWTNANRLAGQTLDILLNTKGVKIVESTSMRWAFKIKLLSPHEWIEHITIYIVKDSV